MKTVKLLLGPLSFFAIMWQFGWDDLFVKSIALTTWVVLWWITEAIPLYITALLPLLLGPLLGLIDKDELALSYGNTMVFLFLGGFLIACAVEKWNVHRKLASMIVQRTGSSPSGVLMGFIIATAFLSMWLSNTGTAIMMLPMAMTVISVLPKGEFTDRFSVALLLSIAFAANIGGTATLIGSPPNIQMSGILADKFGVQVDFMDWMRIGLPFAFVLLGVLFLYLKRVFLRGSENVTLVFKESSSWNSTQIRVIAIFGLTVVLWMIKQQLNDFFNWDITDTQIAIFSAILLFVIPAQTSASSSKLLEWEDTRELPWGILLLFGGGLALARILSNGGVLKIFATWIEKNEVGGYMALLFILIIAGIFLTELMSNLALVTLLIPIVAEIAITMNYPILALCIPVTLSASCAFMLPMATPPNAIVFSSGKLKVQTMAKVGFFMNIFSIALVALVAYFLTLFID